MSDRPARALAIIAAVAVGVAIAIAIIAAADGIETKINMLLNTSDPTRAQALSQAGVNFDQIQSVLRQTKDLLTKLAIGFTAAIVGLVTWVTMSQRRREIGINRMQGQHRGEVIVELLGESLFLCVVGGVVGIALGVALCALIGGALPNLPMKPSSGGVLAIFPSTTILTFVVTAAIASFFAERSNVDTSL